MELIVNHIFRMKLYVLIPNLCLERWNRCKWVLCHEKVFCGFSCIVGLIRYIIVESYMMNYGYISF